MGWRYLSVTLGALTFSMFLCRFFLFRLYESPKSLLARGRQAKAVAVVREIAQKNKTQTWLTEEILNEIGGYPEGQDSKEALPIKEIIKRFFSRFSMEHVGPLFAYK